MSNRIITIEREYASGGREVGELVAKQLGIPFYNREILEMASERWIIWQVQKKLHQRAFCIR
ncbi:MAG: cytidylate kinase family protein [Ruminococcus sp.]|nr:cytidylate kinase family protein [Ruminococcus sp.]